VTGPTSPRDIDGDGNLLAIANPTGVTLYDLSGGGTPTLGGTVALGDPRAVEVRGNHVFVSLATGVDIVDASVIRNPIVIGHIPTVGAAGAVDFHGDLAAVVPLLGGAVSLVDVSNPAAPATVGTLPYGNDVKFLGTNHPEGQGRSGVDLLAICAAGPTLDSCDVDAPSAPALIGSYPSHRFDFGIQRVELLRRPGPGTVAFAYAEYGGPFEGLRLGSSN
jgi:hypothetical protein